MNNQLNEPYKVKNGYEGLPWRHCKNPNPDFGGVLKASPITPNLIKYILIAIEKLYDPKIYIKKNF